MNCAGIYKIKNLINEKIYIGSACNIKQRWADHKKTLRKGIHHNRHLQRSWNKYGENKFQFAIVEELKDLNILIEREQFYLDETRCCEKNVGYNICKIAGSCLGVKHNESFRKKVSEVHSGKTLSEDHKAIISKRHKGKKLSEWHIEKLRKLALEREYTEETRKKMRHSHSGEKCVWSKLTWRDVKEIRELYKTGDYSFVKLAKMYNISSHSTISSIIRNKTWKENN